MPTLAHASVSRPASLAKKASSPALPRPTAIAVTKSPNVAPVAARCACGGSCPRCSATPASVSAERALRQPGQSLPRDIRASYERRFGADLSGVRVHTGSEASRAAAALDANAFATGPHIVFGRGRFAPHTTAGARLLAHELAHILQQAGETAAATRPSPTAGYEDEARRAADATAAGGRFSITRRPETRGRIQRDGPASGEAPRLTLDPELEAEMARLRFQLWLAQQISPGAAPSPGAGGAAPTQTDASNGEPADGGSAAPATPARTIPLPSDWLGTSRLGAETLDFGSLLTPYFDRRIQPNTFGDTRDIGVISQIFADRYALVSRLPDVHLFVPRFARSWIPTTWRVDLASALTSTTVDWALSGQHPTVFDVSNRSWERFTGATTYSTPMVKVPYLSNWWDQLSSGTPGRSR